MVSARNQAETWSRGEASHLDRNASGLADERGLALAGGAALLGWGLAKRGLLGWAAVLGGGALVWRQLGNQVPGLACLLFGNSPRDAAGSPDNRCQPASRVGMASCQDERQTHLHHDGTSVVDKASDESFPASDPPAYTH